jgi:hypothetical protein
MMAMTNLHTGTDGVIIKHYIRSFGPSGGQSAWSSIRNFGSP